MYPYPNYSANAGTFNHQIMDDIGFWILGYALETLFTYWVYHKRGSERLEGTFASVFFIHVLAPGGRTRALKPLSELAGF